MKWRRARAVEWGALEKRYALTGIRGSNPLASANGNLGKFKGRFAMLRLPSFFSRKSDYPIFSILIFTIPVLPLRSWEFIFTNKCSCDSRFN